MKMEKGNPDWDPERLSQEFLAKIEASERYLDKISLKLGLMRSYEFTFDEALAEFYVFNSLRSKPFLSNRNEFLARLRGLLDMEVPKTLGIIDFERFKTVRQNIIENLIRRFEGGG